MNNATVSILSILCRRTLQCTQIVTVDHNLYGGIYIKSPLQDKPWEGQLPGVGYQTYVNSFTFSSLK